VPAPAAAAAAAAAAAQPQLLQPRMCPACLLLWTDFDDPLSWDPISAYE
jgi:hypothetical protein